MSVREKFSRVSFRYVGAICSWRLERFSPTLIPRISQQLLSYLDLDLKKQSSRASRSIMGALYERESRERFSP